MQAEGESLSTDGCDQPVDHVHSPPGAATRLFEDRVGAAAEVLGEGGLVKTDVEGDTNGHVESCSAGEMFVPTVTDCGVHKKGLNFVEIVWRRGREGGERCALKSGNVVVVRNEVRGDTAHAGEEWFGKTVRVLLVAFWWEDKGMCWIEILVEDIDEVAWFSMGACWLM